MPAIPQIIVLLSESDLNICKAGIDALLKLSEQGKVKNFDLIIADVLVAECQGSIGPAIPQMVILLTEWKELDILKIVVDALLKLSDHGKVSNSQPDCC